MNRVVSAFLIAAAIPAVIGAGTLDVFDLGTAGRTTPVDIDALARRNEKHISSLPRPDITGLERAIGKRGPAEISFQTQIPRHSGTPRSRTTRLKQAVPLPEGTRMLFFSTSDKIPRKILDIIDYAYCVGFNSLADIADFREGKKAEFPIQPLLDDKICEWLGIKSLPAIITVKGAVLEIQEGF